MPRKTATRRKAPASDAAAAFLRIPPPPLDWIISETLTVNGRTVEPGTELSITGEGGTRFVFVRHVARPDGREWIDVMETYRGSPQAYRSFRPGRIKTVHRLTKTRSKTT